MASPCRTLVTLVLFALPQAAHASTEQEDARMVLIPAGEFLMGKEGDGPHSPPHTVEISAFYMDKHEVTNAEYQAFCEATDRSLPEFWNMDAFHCGPDYPNHPVVGTSWHDALAYAKWRGVRLPTEAEWEYAARGGLEQKNFSHGDVHDSTLYARKVSCEGTCPVSSYPPNAYGLYDMVGNVCEWVRDYFGDEYYANSPRKNPQGPEDGNFKVIRGGGWHTGPWCSRVYVRNGLKSNWNDMNVGFRCARHIKGSAARRIEEILGRDGIEEALAAYHDMRDHEADDYMFWQSEFNDLGYRLVADERLKDAVEIFKLNAAAFPESFNAWDSLGEAYALLGERRPAIESYRKALELNPRCGTAKEGLKKLGAE